LLPLLLRLLLLLLDLRLGEPLLAETVLLLLLLLLPLLRLLLLLLLLLLDLRLAEALSADTFWLLLLLPPPLLLRLLLLDLRSIVSTGLSDTTAVPLLPRLLLLALRAAVSSGRYASCAAILVLLRPVRLLLLDLRSVDLSSCSAAASAYASSADIGLGCTGGRPDKHCPAKIHFVMLLHAFTILQSLKSRIPASRSRCFLNSACRAFADISPLSCK
jgi:hypothetical protein